MTTSANNTSTQETQKLLLLKKYKRGLKSEEKKKLFHQSLTNYTISKRLPRCTVKPSLIFCTPEKTKILEKFFQSLLKRRNKPVETEQVIHVLSKISCSIKKECDLSHALHDVVTNVNKISFIARLKALKKRIVMADKKLLISLLVSLTKKNNLLKFAIHFMIDNYICIAENRRLCSLMLGLLCMDPHMWSRSLVMLECVRTTFEQLMIRFLLKTGRNPHRYITCDIENYLSMYRTAGVKMNFVDSSNATCETRGTEAASEEASNNQGGVGTAHNVTPFVPSPYPPGYSSLIPPTAEDPYALNDLQIASDNNDTCDEIQMSSRSAAMSGGTASVEQSSDTNTVFV
ncbi:protein U13.5 [Elephant endotheliotropic herpesvirus 2]|nr:protein U13.5 [Elephant endotheliotropic herpesvirus 2]